MFKLSQLALGVALGMGIVVASTASVAADVASASASASVQPTHSVETTAMLNHDGEKLYKSACFVCHGTGAANAPKLGDKAAWAPRIAQGMETVMDIAIKGKGAMPPRGGASKADDATLRAAVEYMVKAGQ
ncbi:MAG: c-type cytochrome [Paralcaligenes sp.]